MCTSISSKTLPFETHIGNNMGVYSKNVSFSLTSVLNGKLTDSNRYLKNRNLIPGSGAAEDGEIGVFGAEKYFNGGMDEEGSQKSTNTRKPPATEPSKKLDKLVICQHDQDHVEEPFKPKPRLATPSVGSESSSINSQRPLLNIVNKNTNSIEKRKSFLSNTLGYCICYSCHDKTVVDVGEISFSNAVTNQTRNNKLLEEEETPSFRENHFSFPTGGSLKVVHFQDEEIERKSLEVFGSPVMGRLRNNKPISLEKRLAMLSWDHTNNNNNNNNNLGGLFYNDDEVNSDCSSDLFEIESLTKQTNSFHSPTASCYAPSEASVEWSVVTASALDFDERRASTASPARMLPPPPPPRRVNVNKEVVVVQKWRSSSLLGCKSEKAVKVAEESNSRKMSANSNSDHLLMERQTSQSSRFEDDTKVGGFGFRSQRPPLRPPPRALTTSSLPRPYSPRLSNINFNIQ